MASRYYELQDASCAARDENDAGFQEQVLKAFSKIKSDAALAEKARKALAIAAALLEEQGTEPRTNGEKSAER